MPEATTWLPGLLGEIAKASSTEAALKLADAHGGTRIYVPRRPKANNWLAKLVGEDEATGISKAFGGEFLTLPLHPTRGIVGMRRRADEALRRGDIAADTIAQQTGYTSRTIYRRQAALRAEAARKGPSLFDLLDSGEIRNDPKQRG